MKLSKEQYELLTEALKNKVVFKECEDNSFQVENRRSVLKEHYAYLNDEELNQLYYKNCELVQTELELM